MFEKTKRNFDGLFFFTKPNPMNKILYDFPALTVSEQLSLLKDKGLIITDPEAAKYWLSNVSYFRFKNYSYPFKVYENGEGNYIEKTTFNNVCDLYSFDRKLKIILFEGIENIEVSVKTHLSNTMSENHGTRWYLNESHFLSESDRRQIIRNARFADDIPKVFNHDSFLQNIEQALQKPTEVFLQQYINVYEPIFPPSWMLMEIITFGTLSLMFENLKPSLEKTKICECFELTKKQLVSWLHCLSFIRNKCAHHGRLVYSKIKFAPSMPQKRSRQFLTQADEVSHDSLYAILCCIQYLLNICNTNSLFKRDLINLVETSYGIDLKRLGFTANWRNEPIWQ